MSKGLEDFEIYKLSERLEIYCHKILATFPKSEFRAKDQLKRSTASTSDNIAEGHARYAFNDKRHKFIIARAEATEARQGFIRAYKKSIIPEKVKNIIEENYTILIKMVNSYINFLKRMNKNNNKPINQ